MVKQMFSRKLNPNTEWIEDLSGRLAYVLVIVLVRIIFAYTPFLSTDQAWTLTNVVHSLVTFFIFHWILGNPVDDSGKHEYTTFWEQIDGGVQFSPARKFLTVVPFALFFLGSHFSNYTVTMFAVNFSCLVLVAFPKLPIMHKVRLFGINKKAE